jgi:hypothetical protein
MAGTAGTGNGGTGNGGTSAGTGGSGGSSAGTGGSGGSSAGTGGSVAEPVDAGADAATDAAVVTDAGLVEIVECPADLDDATEDATTTTGTQEVIITRIVFNDDGGATVTFRAVVDQFNFVSPLVLCTGSEFDEDCDAEVQDVEGTGAFDGGVGDLLEGEEVEFTTPGVNPVAGEIALLNGTDPGSIVRAYVTWGNYTSLPPSEGDEEDDLETRAQAENVWTLGESVELLGNSVIFANGDVTTADGFDACTPDD